MVRLRVSKSHGRKRRAWVPQCSAVPPTDSPGLNEPISRIGSAVSLGVVAERDRLARQVLEDVAVAVELELVVGGRHREIVLGVDHAPALERDDLEPGVGQLLAMMEPTTPVPTTTASTGFNFVAIVSPCAG